MTNITYQKNAILQAIEDAPLISPTLAQLLQITAEPDFALKDVIDIVQCDATLTAKVLKVINSASFNFSAGVASIDRAVSMLGSRTLVGIALATGSGGMFNAPLTGYDDHTDGMWRHELFCAIAARAIALHAKKDCQANLAFTGGLLHDIGKSIISNFLNETCNEVVSDIEMGKTNDYLSAEQSLVGLDHSEIGYRLVQSWNLPEVLQSAIRYHHNPADAPTEYQTICYAVHLGDILAMMAGHGTGSDSMQYQLDENYTQFFDINEDQLSIILLEATEEFQQLEGGMASLMNPAAANDKTATV